MPAIAGPAGGESSDRGMAMDTASRLFEPITLGGVDLANRVAVSPMCQYSAEQGSANDWHVQHLGALSLSGAGLLIVEQTAVEPAGRPLFRRQRAGARPRPRRVPTLVIGAARQSSWRMPAAR